MRARFTVVAVPAVLLLGWGVLRLSGAEGAYAAAALLIMLTIALRAPGLRKLE